jgi:hypothetical protein
VTRWVVTRWAVTRAATVEFGAFGHLSGEDGVIGVVGVGVARPLSGVSVPDWD